MKTHGMFGTSIYGSWSAMIYRCRNPKAKAYPNYGGRGISVCDRWLTFANFMSDMCDGHWDGAEIDRIDNNGNYEPNNCRWATTGVNARNKRNTWLVEYQGTMWKLVELCESVGIPRRNVEARLYKGWDLETALRTPVRSRGVILYSVGNERVDIRKLAEMGGTSVTAIRSRMYRGSTPEAALNP